MATMTIQRGEQSGSSNHGFIARRLHGTAYHTQPITETQSQKRATGNFAGAL